MKKLVFGIIATVLFAFNGNAQDVLNKNNPYDYVGVQHNQVVRAYLEKYGSKKMSTEETLRITNSLCQEEGICGNNLTLEEFNSGMEDFKNNFKDYNLTFAEATKRYKVF